MLLLTTLTSWEKVFVCCWSYASENIATEEGADITAQVVSTNTKRSNLTQGGLVIEIKVTII